MKKKLLLTSVAALSLFAAYNTASADGFNSYSSSGVVNPTTGKLDSVGYTENKVKAQHTGVVAEKDQYKPETPAYNPYHGKPVVYGNGSHVRFHVRDIKGTPVPGVKVDILIFKNEEAFKNHEGGVDKTVVSDEAGDVEYSLPHGGVVAFRVAYVPKGYVVREPQFVNVDGKQEKHYTITGYNGTSKSGSLEAETYVISTVQDFDKDGKADMFTNANVDLVLEKTDTYNVVKEQWVQEEDGWKYYAANKAVSGWKQIEGKWYFFNAEGVSQKWWVQDNGTWYYLNGSGEMQTGWLQDNGTWYYLEASGALKVSQWFEVNGKWYYVDATGALAVNTTVDGYTVNANGEWV